MKKLFLFIFLIFLIPSILAYGGWNEGGWNEGEWGYGTPEPEEEVIVQPSGGGGGGSGGSGGGGTTTIRFEQDEPRNFYMRKNIPISFRINGVSHTLKAKNIGKDYVDYEIKSDVINFRLNIGETKKIDFEDDNYYDLKITLKEIKNSRALTGIERINESYLQPSGGGGIPTEEKPIIGEEEKEEVEPSEEKPTEEKEKKPLTFLFIVIFVILVGCFCYVGYVLYKDYKEKKKLEKKEKENGKQKQRT